LLFGIPLLVGVLITASTCSCCWRSPVFGIRRMEAIHHLARVGDRRVLRCPDGDVAPRPRRRSCTRSSRAATTVRPGCFGHAADGSLTVLGLQGESLFIAMGILGATVMPHNLYLHSSLVQSARWTPARGKREACKMNLVDSASR
jgi:Mn2+/Fe2+ NRAMP family transporter